MDSSYFLTDSSPWTVPAGDEYSGSLAASGGRSQLVAAGFWATAGAFELLSCDGYRDLLTLLLASFSEASAGVSLASAADSEFNAFIS